MSDCEEESVAAHHSVEIFNGFRVIDAHLQERATVENYIQGKTDTCEIRPEVCHPACMFGHWLHGGEEKQHEDLPLFNQLCKKCDEFYELAGQAVLSKNIGDQARADAILDAQSKYAAASAQFQEKVLLLHDKLHKRYRQEDDTSVFQLCE